MTPERFSSYPASSISLTTCPWPLGMMYFWSQSWFFLLLKPWLCRFKGAFTNSKSVWIYHFNRAHQDLSGLSVADCSITQITDWDLILIRVMRLSSVRIREVISLWSSEGVSAKPSCSFGLDAGLQKSERNPALMAFPPDSEHIKFLTRQIWGLQRDRRLTNRSTPPLSKEALGSLKYRLKTIREVMLRGWGQWKHCCWEPTVSECICMCTETKFVWKRTHMQDSQA